MGAPDYIGGRHYRADLDGMRGVAVLAVIVFHIAPEQLPGGFVGVDLFFVLSGFLITGRLLADIEAGTFSLLDFYRRRIKRIAPALLLVIGVTLIASQLLLLPKDAQSTAQSALASAAGVANIFFWLFQDTSYFAPDSRQTPLLHLWSIGVEEQFYLLWPVILWSFACFKSARLFACLLVCALSSFALGSFLYSTAPLFVFYMLPTRIGELLAGAMLAIVAKKDLQRFVSSRLATIISLLGAVLVCGTMLLLDEHQAFPGLLALLPVGGTVALVLAGLIGPTAVTRVLATAPLRWAGLVSYSAYLWHWPVLAFLRYGYGEIDAITAWLAFITIIVLSTLSWRYVELPARRSHATFSAVLRRQYLVPAALVTSIATFALATGGLGVHVFSSHYQMKLARLREHLLPAYRFDYICQRRRLTIADLNNPNCIVGADGSDEPQMLLWGDSNASHYVGVVGAFAQHAGFRFRNVESQSCPPILSDPSPYLYEQDLSNCTASINLMRSQVGRYRIVMLAASWPGYEKERSDFIEQVFETSRELIKHGTKVLLIGKAPVPEGFDRLCNLKALRFPGLKCDTTPRPLSKEIARTNDRLRDFAMKHSNVEYFDLTSLLCPDNQCRAYNQQGVPLYVDSHHLSLMAAWSLGRSILARDGLPTAFQELIEFGETRPGRSSFASSLEPLFEQ